MLMTTNLQADIKVVGDANNIMVLQGIVGEALNSLMMQEADHQLPLPLHFHCCCKCALACKEHEFTEHVAWLILITLDFWLYVLHSQAFCKHFGSDLVFGCCAAWSCRKVFISCR